MNWKNSRPQVAITYSHTLLVYAEAQAMSSSPDASAYNAINQVRNRAGLPDLTEDLSQEEIEEIQRLYQEVPGNFAEDISAPIHGMIL